MIYLVLLFGTLAISFWAMSRVRSVYHKYSQVPASSGITGAQAAARILDRAGIHDVDIVEHNELLGDHYDPTHKRLVLSTQNFHGTSLAALGVAAHECGHAIQHQIAYAPLQWRMSAVTVTNYASQITMILPMFFMFTHMISMWTGVFLMAVALGIIMLFNLVTLPVEFDASRRAKAILNGMGFIRDGQEADGVKKTLDAAGWTYVAAFITSLAYFLYYLLPLLTGRDDDR
jgi:Zn-dependent membrane protease YugP